MHINFFTGNGVLHTHYFNVFLTFKTKASGFPMHVKTQADAEPHITNYLKNANIELDLEN